MKRRLRDTVIASSPQFFVGRVRELEIFRTSLDRLSHLGNKSSRNKDWQDWQPKELFPRVFLFSGKGGIGKSTLVYKLNEYCQSQDNVVVFFVDWEKEDFGSKEDMIKIIHDCIVAKGETLGRDYSGKLKELREVSYKLRELRAKAVKERRQFSEDMSKVGNIAKGAITGASSYLFPPAGIAATVSLEALDAFDLGLPQIIEAGRNVEEKFKAWLERRWIKENFDLYSHPNRTLLQKLVEGIDSIAQSQQVVFVFDTIEVIDPNWIKLLEDLIFYGSNRILYVVAGQRDMSKEYGNLLGGQLVFASNLLEFYMPDVESYLKLRQFADAKELAPYIHSITQGVPLGVRVAVEMILNAQIEVQDILGELQIQEQFETEVLQKLLEVFLKYCIDERDRGYIYSLAMARHFDPDLLSAMWNHDEGSTLVEEIIKGLAIRYPFIIAGAVVNEMDSTVRKFLRKTLRRSPITKRRMEKMNGRACLALQDKLEALQKRDDNDPNKYYWNVEWQESALDLANHLLWEANPQDGIKFLCHLFVDATVLLHDFRKKLRHILEDTDLLDGLSRPEERSIWQLLRTNLDVSGWQVTPTLRELYRLADESYLRISDKVRKVVFEAKEYLSDYNTEKSLQILEALPGDWLLGVDKSVKDELSNVYLKIAMFIGEKGDGTASNAYFRKAQTLAPQNAFVYSRWGDLLLYAGQFSDAREKYAEATRIDRGFKYAQEQLDNANQLMTPAKSIPHQNSRQAYSSALSGELETALDFYLKALNLSDKDSSLGRRLQIQLGRVLTWLGRYQEALKTFKRASGVGAFDGAGHVWFLLGDLKKAEKEFLRANKESETYSNAYYGLGRIRLEQGEYQSAEDKFLAAQKFIFMSSRNKNLLMRSSVGGVWWEGYQPWDPNPYWLFKSIGIAQILAGRVQSALNSFSEAEKFARNRLTEVEKDFTAQYALVLALLGQDQPKLAAKTLEDALTLCTAEGVLKDFLKDLELLKRVEFLKNHAISLEKRLASPSDDSYDF